MLRLACLALLAAALSTPSAPVDDMPVALRGALDAEVRAGHLVPVVVEARRVGLCLEVPPTVDSHGWRGELRAGRSVLAAGLEPSPRRSGTLCFETEIAEDALSFGDHRLCAVVRDRVDGAVYRPPCRRFRYRGPWEEPMAVWGQVRTAMQGEADPVAELDRLADQARLLGAHFMSVQIELVAVHVLVQRGTPGDRSEALRRLDALPGWLADEAASHWRGQERLQRARVLQA
ncbi:MAG: hypothetical protein AAFY88_25505, partial [Acidobacteriota bacterium]